jgi:hypothetical protein
MDLFYVKEPFKSIYDRTVTANPRRTSKLYYSNQASSAMEIVNLLQHDSELFGTYSIAARALFGTTVSRSRTQTTGAPTDQYLYQDRRPSGAEYIRRGSPHHRNIEYIASGTDLPVLILH